METTIRLPKSTTLPSRYSSGCSGTSGCGGPPATRATSVFSPSVVSTTSRRRRSRASSPRTRPSTSKTGSAEYRMGSVIPPLRPRAGLVAQDAAQVRGGLGALLPLRPLARVLAHALRLGGDLGGQGVHAHRHRPPPR